MCFVFVVMETQGTVSRECHHVFICRNSRECKRGSRAKRANASVEFLTRLPWKPRWRLYSVRTFDSFVFSLFFPNITFDLISMFHLATCFLYVFFSLMNIHEERAILLAEECLLFLIVIVYILLLLVFGSGN